MDYYKKLETCLSIFEPNRNYFHNFNRSLIDTLNP